MKQNMLQMLKCVLRNEKESKMLIDLLVKYIRKIIGQQKRGKKRSTLIPQANDVLNLPKYFVVHADKGFDSLSNRWQISQKGGKSEIPVKNMGFSTEYPKQRDGKSPIVEHCFAWLNSFISLTNIHVKTLNSLYELHFIAFIVILLRSFKQKNIKQLIQAV